VSGVWVGGATETVLGLLDRRLAADPDGPYLDVCGTAVSAAEVAAVADRLAGALAGLGVGPGDRVATLVENSAEAMFAWWGTVRAGAVAVPINTAYKGRYLRHQLADSGSRVLMVEADLVDRAARVVDQVPELGHVVVLGDAVDLPGVAVHRWDDVVAAGAPAPAVTVRPADLAT
jgi:carnitine-CoA ligase